MADSKRVFIYRRTHTDDPCKSGVFGVCDCMKTHRKRQFDAALGIGGARPWEDSKGIARRLTWVGIGRRPDGPATWQKGPLVTFEHFCLMNEEGPLLEDCAPLLAEHMFAKGKIPRSAMSCSLSPNLQGEVQSLLRKYEACGPSAHETCQCPAGAESRESKREKGEGKCRPGKPTSSC